VGMYDIEESIYKETILKFGTETRVDVLADVKVDIAVFLFSQNTIFWDVNYTALHSGK
jgi:hypothetical protein